MDHPRLSLEPQRRVRQQLADCSAVLEDLTGQAVRFFRPPFGGRRPVVLRIAGDLGLTPVMWNVAGYDWDPIGTDGILARLHAGILANRNRRRGSNILLHDGGHRAMGTHRMDTVHAVDHLLSSEAFAGQQRWVTIDAWAPEG
jgi:peptidoglycan/xylan/chitin deacetylase (PgdA/CDA1 family)